MGGRLPAVAHRLIHNRRQGALALLGGQRCKTPEEYKAWSQNLGHEHVLTTFCSYGDVSSYRQTEIMRSFASPALIAPG